MLPYAILANIFLVSHILLCYYFTYLNACEISSIIWEIQKIFPVLHSTLYNNNYLFIENEELLHALLNINILLASIPNIVGWHCDIWDQEYSSGIFIPIGNCCLYFFFLTLVTDSWPLQFTMAYSNMPKAPTLLFCCKNYEDCQKMNQVPWSCPWTRRCKYVSLTWRRSIKCCHRNTWRWN